MICQRCGACCRHLHVECDAVDAMREPRLLEPAANHLGVTMDELRSDEITAPVIKLWRPEGCPFLTAENECEIYPTRPRDCVGFDPGSPICREARAALAQAEAGD